MVKDKLRISTFGLPEIKQRDMQLQKLLSDGYKVYFCDGIKCAKKGNEVIKLK